MIKIDFLNTKTIFHYVIIMAIALLSGFFLKDGIAILFILLILYFSITKNRFKAIEFFLLWFFISGFFVGQGLIMNLIISNYFAKPAFILLIVFVFNFKYIPRHLYSAKFLITWVIFLVITLLSSITQGQTPFVVISISSFFILYLLLQSKGITNHQYKSYLNLFIAVAVVQTIVSFLQISEIIPASTRMMESDSGGTFLWSAGLDDVASGTFGASASHTTSWYAALISLFMFLMYSFCKRNIYLVFMTISFLQFATVDSKIIMGVTLLMFIYSLFHILKNKSKFKISIQRYITIFVIILISGFGLTIAWNAYYEYSGKITGGNRTNLESIYDSEIKESIISVFENLDEWGKIKGYQFVFEDFIEAEPIRLIWGYGVDGFTSKGKSGYIISKLAPIMQANNLTNSNSGLINVFAKHGFLGFLLFIISITYWFKYNNKGKSDKDIIKTSLLKIYLMFSILVSFLYAIEIAVIPIIAFAGLISILSKLSNFNNNIIIKLKKT